MKITQKWLLFLILAGMAPLPILAQEEAEKPWKLSIGASYLNTTGNTRTEVFGSRNKFDYDWAKTALRTEFNAYTAKEDDSTTAENYEAQEKYEWKFKKPNYLFQLGRWEKDRFKGLDNRTTLGLGYGRGFFKTDRHQLIGEAGYNHIWEDNQNDDAEDFGSARLYGFYGYKISPTATFSQSAEYLDDLDSSDSYRINTLTKLKAKLTTLFSLEASYEVKYDNNPEPGFTETDTITSIGLVADF